MNIVKAGLLAAIAVTTTTVATPSSEAAPLPTHVAAMKAMLDNNAVQVQWRGGWGYRGWGYRGVGYRGWGYRGAGWGAVAAGAVIGGAIASSAYYGGGYPYGYGGGGYGYGYASEYCPPAYGYGYGSAGYYQPGYDDGW